MKVPIFVTVAVLLFVAASALADDGSIAPASTGRAFASCLEYFAKHAEEIKVPEPLSAYVAMLESSKLTFHDKLAWSNLTEAERKEFVSEYPSSSCESFGATVSEIFQKVKNEDEKCSDELDVLYDNDETLKQARAHPNLGPILKAEEACFTFRPDTFDLDNGQAVQMCFQLLVEEFAKIKVPEPISDYLAMLESSELTFDDDLGWSGLTDAQRKGYMSEYPVVSCESYLVVMSTVLEKVGKNCAEQSDEVLMKVRADSNLAPVMKAYEACLAFEPHTREMGKQI